tara:strand:- start:23598 stop:25559 length:1962 start_codon:yes stop_codon:yes gene_type:complete
MIGLLIYSFIGAGLGCWPRLNIALPFPTIGLRLTLGYAILTVLGFLMLLAGLAMVTILQILVLLAVTGIVLRLRAIHWRPSWAILLSHPTFIFLIIGFVVVILRPELDYLPVGQDEFSHWLSNPLRLNAEETWQEAHGSFNLRGYLPGWPFLLALPWQLRGISDLGISATAPFVFCVAVTALVYDIVTGLVRKEGHLHPIPAGLIGWTFILLFTAAQAMGPLWSKTLLIEAPQIYCGVAFLLLIYASELSHEYHRHFEGAAGTVLAACYLIKSAAILFIPGIALVCLLILFRGGSSRLSRLRSVVATGALLMGPTAAIAAIWALDTNISGCMYRPLETLSAEALVTASNYDWSDLANRFFGAIVDYTLSYKLILTLASIVGLIGTVLSGRHRTPILLVTTATVYFAALYWFHLTCFGEYYFNELNSIPRFTRVILWTLHAVGLVMLIDVTLFAIRRGWGSMALAVLSTRRDWLIAVCCSLFVLGGSQVVQVWESVEQITTRRGQPIDPRIAQSKQSAETIELLIGKQLPKQPKLLILSQGLDTSVISHAEFFALGRRRGDTIPRYSIINEVSWAPTPKNIWQIKSDATRFRQTLARADIIWPMVVDKWLVSVLASDVSDQDCIKDLTRHYIIRRQNSDGKSQFRCFVKALPSK